MKATSSGGAAEPIRRARWVGLALLGAAVVLAPTAAGAEGIFRCTGADGKTVYTSNPGACPNAKPHVLKSRVQNVVEGQRSPRRSPGSRASRPAARAPAGGDGLERMWRNKRSEKQQELGQIDRRLKRAMTMAKGCNRGAEWYSKDEAGMRKHISCDKVKSNLRKIEQERADVQEYLRSGIEDDCRKAGCLPGWVR